MKILLLQDQVFLPSLGGGNKANRLLLEGLAANGHECRAVASALTTRAGPTSREALEADMRQRGIRLRSPSDGVFAFAHNGVHVEAIDFVDADAMRRHVVEAIETFQPDWVLTSDDKRRVLLDSASSRGAERVIVLLQTVFHLPFGPHAVRKSKRQTELMRRAQGLVAISEYLRTYLEKYADLEATLVPLPVYGPGPFTPRNNFARGFVTMINPCVEKGLDIFLALASRYPTIDFAAVPTWGADNSVLRALAEAPNVTVRPPVDDIDELLEDTRILLVPSVWPETFGYVVPEAMLRGIPVIASDIGGLAEAKLGVDYLLPVRPAEWRNGGYVCPEQDLGPWVNALDTLLTDRLAYRRCSAASRRAALRFASRARTENFESYLRDCAAADGLPGR
ncbi:MAG: glycosyltransferase [Acidobacteriota bacterium]|jgi:glycosyltransferase involved in cell wall biosynthesis